MNVGLRHANIMRSTIGMGPTWAWVHCGHGVHRGDGVHPVNGVHHGHGVYHMCKCKKWGPPNLTAGFLTESSDVTFYCKLTDQHSH